jgi:hypothetical protein
MRKRTAKLKCPHMANWKIKSCEALITTYNPSQFQFEEYCKSRAHIKCPFYLDALENRTFAGIGK